MSENREIRFITPDYQELFRIPDGGYISVSHLNGEKYIAKCQHLDETHVSINGECYHIHQFAEKVKRCGATVKPAEKKPRIREDDAR